MRISRRSILALPAVIAVAPSVVAAELPKRIPPTYHLDGLGEKFLRNGYRRLSGTVQRVTEALFRVGAQKIEVLPWDGHRERQVGFSVTWEEGDLFYSWGAKVSASSLLEVPLAERLPQGRFEKTRRILQQAEHRARTYHILMAPKQDTAHRLVRAWCANWPMMPTRIGEYASWEFVRNLDDTMGA